MVHVWNWNSGFLVIILDVQSCSFDTLVVVVGFKSIIQMKWWKNSCSGFHLKNKHTQNFVEMKKIYTKISWYDSWGKETEFFWIDFCQYWIKSSSFLCFQFVIMTFLIFDSISLFLNVMFSFFLFWFLSFNFSHW